MADDLLDCADPPLPGRGPCRAAHGYVKICTEWAARLWLEDGNTDLTHLNKSMTKFDTCGA